MEISIKIDDGEGQLAGANTGLPSASQKAPAQADNSSPPPGIAAAAAAAGAIDAGPAHIPPGQTPQPVAHIGANARTEPSTAGHEQALAAGAAPEYAHETAELIRAEGEEDE